MKRSYKLEDLCCANCAAKMETAINKLENVDEAVINFMSQRLTIVADESCFEDVLEASEKIIRKIEPNCRLVR